MGARYYDPLGGRFLSPDPAGHPICLDLYHYANGDPINFFDPDGRLALPVFNPIMPVGLKNIRMLGGIAHGVIDFAISNAHILEQGAMFIGSDDIGLSLAHRGIMFNALSEQQAGRVDAFADFFMGIQGVGHDHPYYSNVRHGTSLGLEVASLAAGGYAVLKGGYNLLRGTSAFSSLFKTSSKLPKLAEIQPLTSFENSNKIF